MEIKNREMIISVEPITSAEFTGSIKLQLSWAEKGATIFTYLNPYQVRQLSAMLEEAENELDRHGLLEGI